MSDIPKPLTEEDWTSGRFNLIGDGDVVAYRLADGESIAFYRVGVGEILRVDCDTDLHALAAFALAPLPFAFSGHDVEALDAVSNYIASLPGTLPSHIWNALVQLHFITERIAALLPID